jgi:hypothetical protein
MNQTVRDRRIERITHMWYIEAEALSREGLESSSLVLAAALQLARYAIEWQPAECRNKMREKAVRLIATDGTSVDPIVGRPQ